MNEKLIADLADEVLNSGPACEDAEVFTGPDLFETELPAVRQAREAEAKRICATCPARAACLSYALATRPAVGVWAGFTADELRAGEVAA